ncbi:uncharacterized protein LOC132928719 [Rhopalosiphum padi]|uniref:uncharacterized protein LOC132928719 n=1 Tax=Rhopalosiphum padi TaxID=40932 RepID=UPI00298E942B|nr:uncharacterized protein LOC132928719 [Rhopalosiphum padi]
MSQIKAVHDLALRVVDEPDLGSTLTHLTADLDSLWTQFRLEDDAVLDGLTDLDRLSEYDVGLTAEIRKCISDYKVAAAKLVPKGVEAIDMSYLQVKLGSTNSPQESDQNPFDFDGDFRLWPTFRDRFKEQVDAQLELSNIDKMYYLIRCLTGEASDAIRGVPVSGDNYVLALSLLSERFYRPRLVATSLLDRLLSAPTMSQESLQDLNNFVGTVNERISLLEALKVPNLESFILFTIAFRCLPVATRKLFESGSSADYPSILYS